MTDPRPLKITRDDLARATPGPQASAASVRCPLCGAGNDAAALQCNACGEPLESAKTKRSRPRSTPESIAFARRSSVALFVLAMLGVPAPLVLVFGSTLLVRRHRAFVDAGAAHRALAYSAVLLSLVYCGLGLVFLIQP
ncbi:MAG: hypothetical protein KY476_06345 [Planctomycetes bacterium]|nr:hypothetical protein [Planctomycetota bacterium]